MNWRSWAKRLFHYLPLWAFGLGILIPAAYAGTEFCLAHAGKPKLLYDWQEIDIGFIFGTVMFSSFALSFVWSILIHRFWRKEDRPTRWGMSVLYFVFPIIACTIISAVLPCSSEKRVEKRQRIWCQGKMKLIAMMLYNYANDNRDHYPDKLEMLVPEYLSEKDFHCPAAKVHHGFSDYNYYGKGRKETDAPFVILEDKIDNHRGNYKNFLRSDGWIGSARKIE